MNILSIDPANSSGYCVITLNKETKEARIQHYGFIDVATGTSTYLGDHCIDLMHRVTELIDRHCIHHITVEDYFFSMSFATGSSVNVAYRTAVYIAARQRAIPYTILNTSEWKKHVAKRATPTKAQVEKWGKTDAKKLFIQQALWEHYNIRFPNHSLSEKTGKPILFRFDIVDVVGQAIFYVCFYEGANKVQCDIKIPKDVVHKSTVKKIFTYPDA